MFIVSKEGNNSQIELFIKDESQGVLLKEEGKDTFKNDKYTYNVLTKELSVDGKVTYK